MTREKVKRRRYRSVKIDEDSYILLEKISALMGMRKRSVLTMSVVLLCCILDGREEYVRRIIEKLRERYQKRLKRIEKMMETLESILS